MNRLAEHRIALGLTQPQVAEALRAVEPRIDVSMVSRFERGACLPTPEVLAAFESILQAPRAALFSNSDIETIQDCSDELPPLPAQLQRLVDYIPYGAENAVSRQRLAELLRLSDRKMRELIEQARKCGCIILNAQDGHGYYRSDDLDDIERQYRQDTSRALSILARRKRARQLLKAAGRQV